MLGNAFLRNVLIVSIASVILLPVCTALFIHPAFTELITEDAEDNAVRITKHLMQALLSGSNRLKSGHLPESFYREVAAINNDFKIAKMRVFSSSGEIIYSTEPEEIGSVNKESYFTEIVAKGNNHRKVVKKNTRTLEGQLMKADVVETYVPAMSRNQFIGAVEVYFDITGKKGKLQGLVSRSNAMLVAVSIFLLSVILVVSIRAANDIQEKNRLEREREGIIIELKKAAAEITVLSGFLPICSSCKKIRDDQGYWKQIEAYISEHSGARFSHGLCPECARKLYPRLRDEK